MNNEFQQQKSFRSDSKHIKKKKNLKFDSITLVEAMRSVPSAALSHEAIETMVP